jgi:hypothetical protein
MKIEVGKIYTQLIGHTEFNYEILADKGEVFGKRYFYVRNIESKMESIMPENEFKREYRGILHCSMVGKGFCPYEGENGKCNMTDNCSNHIYKIK